VQADSARELKARILTHVRALPGAREVRAEVPRVAVGLAPAGRGVRVAVRLERARDRSLLPDLGAAAGRELDVRAIGRTRALTRFEPGDLQRRVRPLRPGASVAHPSVTAGTLGGFVRVGGRLAILSNNHVLAAGDAASVGDPVLQPGPYDDGALHDRVATLRTFPHFCGERPNLIDAATAVLDAGVGAEPGRLPGGALTGVVPLSAEIDPGELVEKLGRTTGHTRGRISAVEVDGVAVQYDSLSSPQGVHTFDDQLEVEGLTGAFSAGGDSGSVIWRSADRAPLGLLFAGSQTGGRSGGGVTFAHPLATVLAALEAEWVSS
jgi:hypothetical protein